MESLHDLVMTRQSEVDKLMEQSQEQQRENQIVKRKARVNEEMASKLQEDLQREKQRSERLEEALKEAMNKLDDSQVSGICNTATVESLRSEIKQMSKKHNETLSGLNNVQNNLLSTINQQHASQVNSLEKTVANLQRANLTLENERSRCLREKQSSDQRYYSLEQLCNNKENEYKGQIQLLLDRANNTEVQLDISLTAQQDLKREVVSLKEKLFEMQSTIKEMKSTHEKQTEQLKKELLNTGQENESLSIQIPTLRNQMETTRLECRHEMEKIKTDTERKIREAEVECEAMRVSKLNDQLKAKESRIAFEKAVELHQTSIEKMKSETTNMRMELEKIISDERSVNQVSDEIKHQERSPV